MLFASYYVNKLIRQWSLTDSFQLEKFGKLLDCSWQLVNYIYHDNYSTKISQIIVLFLSKYLESTSFEAGLWYPLSRLRPHRRNHQEFSHLWLLPDNKLLSFGSSSQCPLLTFSRRNFTQLVCPSQTAASKGEIPCLSAAFKFAPWNQSWSAEVWCSLSCRTSQDTLEQRYLITSSCP